MKIIKRNGNKVDFDLNKWQNHISRMCDDIASVSPSMIEIESKAQFIDGMSTIDLDKIALKAMINLIDEELRPDVGNVNYQYVAGRHYNTMLRKQVYGSYTIPSLYEIVKKNCECDVYTKNLLEWYSEDEWNQFDKFVDHSKDEELAISQIDQLAEKYLVKNRDTNQIYETPQIRYIVAAATAHHMEDKKVRMKLIHDYYDHASSGDFTLSTPVLGGLGTKTPQFSSCTVIRVNDTINSIFAAGEMMGKYAAKRAGIGFEFGRIRPLGSKIRNGEVKHTGMIPFLKKWYGDLRCVSQGGIRNSSATFTYPIWHYQFDDLIQLKNNRGTDETRVRFLDYSVVVCNFLLRRIKNKQNITFFDPNEVPDLYEAYYRDIKLFEHLYVKYESRTDIKKKVDSAENVFKNLLLKERIETGRIYITFADNMQKQSAFNPITHPIYSSNLCVSGDTYINVLDEVTNINSFVKIKNLGQLDLLSRKISVLSSNILSGIDEYKQIENFSITKKNADLVEVTVEHSNRLICTPCHLIYTHNRGYVRADELIYTDILRFILGKNISNVIVKKLDYTEDVYDITVKDNHNFYANGILVHNCQEIFLPTQSFESVDDVATITIELNGIQKTFPNDDVVVLDNNETKILRYLEESDKINYISTRFDGKKYFGNESVKIVKRHSPAIALCTLGSSNWGRFKRPEEMRSSLRALVRSLDNLLSYQDFLSVQSAASNNDFRPLGIGITNLAYWHAKRKLKYGSPEALLEVKKWIEYQTYYLIEATNDLAKERGSCKLSHTTKYGNGILPIDNMSEIAKVELTNFNLSTELDYEKLRDSLKKHGVRNATVSAFPPVESSSVALNSTNGFEMIKQLIVTKESKGGIITQVVPEYKKLKHHYQKMYDEQSCIPYMKTCAVIQSFADQGMSANTFASSKNYRNTDPSLDGKISVTDMLNLILNASAWGLKSLYYHLTDKSAIKNKLNELEEPMTEAIQNLDISTTIQEEEHCESCVL